MEGLIRWWVRNPVAANLLMLIIITAGWLGLRDIEKEAFPSVQPDIVQVEVIWPGAVSERGGAAGHPTRGRGTEKCLQRLPRDLGGQRGFRVAIGRDIPLG